MPKKPLKNVAPSHMQLSSFLRWLSKYECAKGNAFMKAKEIEGMLIHAAQFIEAYNLPIPERADAGAKRTSPYWRLAVGKRLFRPGGRREQQNEASKALAIGRQRGVRFVTRVATGTKVKGFYVICTAPKKGKKA